MVYLVWLPLLHVAGLVSWLQLPTGAYLSLLAYNPKALSTDTSIGVRYQVLYYLEFNFHFSAVVAVMNWWYCQDHTLQACTMDWQTSRKIDCQKLDANNVVSSILPIALKFLQWLLSNQEWTSLSWMQQFTYYRVARTKRPFHHCLWCNQEFRECMFNGCLLLRSDCP